MYGMDFLRLIFDFILHIDEHIDVFIQTYGIWTHLILFLVIFFETGLVVTPFLPGDSLLFAAGAFAARGSLEVGLLLVLLSLAAIAGDALNYWIGSFIGRHAFGREGGRFFKKEYLERTERFYERHGKKTIILARFIPIVRTFAPFVAGVGKMRYREFAFWNVLGGLAWVFLFVLGGYFFGNIPFVAKNFELVILAIIAISLLPLLREWWRQRRVDVDGN
jgi:membrane-associated protein